MAKGYLTFGEYLYKEKIQNSKPNKREKVTNRITVQNKNKEFFVTRNLILEEIKKILSIQKQYHINVLTDDYIKNIKKAIFYETEKITPEPENCPYFKDEKRLPRSHKLNEHIRIYEALNNSSYSTTGEYRKKQFSKEEKEKLFEFLLKNKELTEKKSKRIIKIYRDVRN